MLRKNVLVSAMTAALFAGGAATAQDEVKLFDPTPTAPPTAPDGDETRVEFASEIKTIEDGEGPLTLGSFEFSLFGDPDPANLGANLAGTSGGTGFDIQIALTDGATFLNGDVTVTSNESASGCTGGDFADGTTSTAVLSAGDTQAVLSATVPDGAECSIEKLKVNAEFKENEAASASQGQGVQITISESGAGNPVVFDDSLTFASFTNAIDASISAESGETIKPPFDVFGDDEESFVTLGMVDNDFTTGLFGIDFGGTATNVNDEFNFGAPAATGILKVDGDMTGVDKVYLTSGLCSETPVSPTAAISGSDATFTLNEAQLNDIDAQGKNICLIANDEMNGGDYSAAFTITAEGPNPSNQNFDYGEVASGALATLTRSDEFVPDGTKPVWNIPKGTVDKAFIRIYYDEKVNDELGPDDREPVSFELFDQNGVEICSIDDQLNTVQGDPLELNPGEVAVVSSDEIIEACGDFSGRLYGTVQAEFEPLEVQILVRAGQGPLVPVSDLAQDK